MAVKIVRQAKKIALLGAPTSAAAMSAGHEGAPAALRAAGLVDGCAKSVTKSPTWATTPSSFSNPTKKVPARAILRA